jgi:hypothetical protein
MPAVPVMQGVQHSGNTGKISLLDLTNFISKFIIP